MAVSMTSILDQMSSNLKGDGSRAATEVGGARARCEILNRGKLLNSVFSSASLGLRTVLKSMIAARSANPPILMQKQARAHQINEPASH